MIKAVRRAFPDTVFHVDCNSAYQLRDADMLKQLDQFNLAMIEQPLAHDDLLDHAKLQKMLRTAICLDEKHYLAGKGPPSHRIRFLPVDQHQDGPGRRHHQRCRNP